MKQTERKLATPENIAREQEKLRKRYVNLGFKFATQSNKPLGRCKFLPVAIITSGGSFEVRKVFCKNVTMKS